MCLDKCLRELEHQSRLAREDEAKRRREVGMAPSRIAEEGAAATGTTEGASHLISELSVSELSISELPNVSAC